MAIGNSIWDSYQQQIQQGWTPPPGIEGVKGVGFRTSGNAQWQANQPGGGGQPAPAPSAPPIPPIPSAPPRQPYMLPAVNNFMQGNPSGAMTNLGPQFQPSPIPSPNTYQAGSMGANLGNTLGQNFENPFASLFNQNRQPQQPTMTGYHWNAATGGLQGGNNAWTRQYFSDGTMKSFTGGVEDNQPLAPTIWTQPGVNADVRALSDPSVGALDDATRTKNQFGQKVITTPGGSQMISGPAGSPSFGSLYGSTQSTNAKGQEVLNTPSGGQAIAGKSLRKPLNKGAANQGQVWGLGGWY